MDASAEKLQALAQATYGLDVNGAARRATGLGLDLNGVCRRLWGKERNEALDELSQLLGDHALLLDGEVGSFAETPDALALDITGDIDLRVEYVHTGGTDNRTLVSKWVGTGDQRSYLLRTSTFSTLDIIWSTDGVDAPSHTHLLITDGITPQVGALRKTLDVDVGLLDRVIDTYIAPTMDGPWELLDSATVEGATSIFAGTAPLRIGELGSGGNRFTGRITRVEVRNGIDGTVVANPDFRNLAPGTTSFTDGAGLVWTLNGGAVIV